MESTVCLGVVVIVLLALYIVAKIQLKITIDEYQKELRLCDQDLIKYYKQKNSGE